MKRFANVSMSADVTEGSKVAPGEDPFGKALRSKKMRGESTARDGISPAAATAECFYGHAHVCTPTQKGETWSDLSPRVIEKYAAVAAKADRPRLFEETPTWASICSSSVDPDRGIPTTKMGTSRTAGPRAADGIADGVADGVAGGVADGARAVAMAARQVSAVGMRSCTQARQ